MPNYEYQCPNCQLKVEILKPLSESETTEDCPVCSTDMNKIITAAAFKIVGGY